MVIFYLFVLISINHFLFIRYYPIYGLHVIDKKEIEINNHFAIDIRDYNEAYKDPVYPGINIPIAYLKRYYSEIPNNDLVVVASNCMERNVGVRILRKKGFKVIGYTIPSQKKIVNEKQISTESYC
ncbi:MULTISPECIES: hypothetical protein [Metabacillus]|uniref:Rhodanese domain-containing protein n=2 Tax=Metabacillus TaxID=2675233 RepID=A0ABX6S3J9_9BACI|nr:hypothetical protein [Metabacillus sp. KUDC1714]QNF28579.1 hypothetical protein HUW50_14460 [Metabacillus sp. KUDC1714]